MIKSILFLGLVIAGCQSDDPMSPGDEVVRDPGQVSISPSPSEIDAPWFLIRPDKRVERGSGSQVLDNLPPGQYRLGWGAVPDWQSPTPNPELQALGSGAEITFSASYREIEEQTGSIAIDTTPDEINAPWTLEGPNGFYHEGSGDDVLNGRESGSYTITWGEVQDYEEQEAQQSWLDAGGRIDFGGSYVYQAPPTVGTILIDVNPDHINAPWSVSGPGGYANSGNGDVSLTDSPTGDYVVSFGTVNGWYSPVPTNVNVNLTDGELETVSGSWQEIGGPDPGDPQISGVNGQFNNGGAVTLTGSEFGTNALDIDSGVGPDGWIEANSQGTAINQLQDGSDWATYSTQQPPFIDGNR
ncbi:MAG: hypothetical protein DRR04_14235, partial [Gammaproteobacteria bacterium]